jgi:hypothetical protein
MQAPDNPFMEWSSSAFDCLCWRSKSFLSPQFDAGAGEGEADVRWPEKEGVNGSALPLEKGDARLRGANRAAEGQRSPLLYARASRSTPSGFELAWNGIS